MKRFLPVLVVAAALVAVPAASAAPPTLQSGKLIVAFGDAAPGFASGTIRGNTITNPRGYEVDLASAIAKKLGLTPGVDVLAVEQPLRARHEEVRHLVPGGDDHGPAEADGRLHLVVPEREPGRVDLQAGDPPKSLADLKKLQLCAQTNTTGLDWINNQLHPDKKPQTFPATAAAYQAVQINRCQALILDVPLVSLQKKQKPTAYGPVAGQVVTHEVYGAVLQKGSKLTPVVDGVIKKLIANGTVGKLQKKWFNLNFAKIPVLK